MINFGFIFRSQRLFFSASLTMIPFFMAVGPLEAQSEGLVESQPATNSVLPKGLTPD